jgi:hypothetical protein
MEDLFPPGFRFFPTEEELVSFYLNNKLQGQSNSIDRVIPVIDINGVEPWNLPSKYIKINFIIHIYSVSIKYFTSSAIHNILYDQCIQIKFV